MAERPRYLLVKGHSGIGNRLQALAESIIYARLTGRTLVVDWNDSLYSSDGRDVFHRLFDLPSAGMISDIPPNASVAPAIWSGHLDFSYESMRREYQIPMNTARTRLSIDPDVDYSETVAVIYDWTFRLPRGLGRPSSYPDEWHDTDATQLLRMLLRDRVRLNSRLARRIEAFALAYFETPTIGVHIRQTDNMSADWIERKGASVRAFEAALDQQIRAAPNATIFVATDNCAVQKHFYRRYKSVVWHQKWFPLTPGEAIHRNDSCPDKLRAAEDALIDLYLLSRCDVLIHSSRTTFAQCATHLSPQPRESHIDVIAPGSSEEAIRWVAKRPPLSYLPRHAVRCVFRRLRQALQRMRP